MDTSETYIKMCDCEEIQGQETKGSIMAERWNSYGVIESDNVVKIANEMATPYHLWLPRQDQTQKMISKNNIIAVMDAFISFYESNIWTFSKIRKKRQAPWTQDKGERIAEFKTLEQFWLAFYMHEKHQKKWDARSGEWVTVPTNKQAQPQAGE